MAHAWFRRRYGIVAGMDLQPIATLCFTEKIDNAVLEWGNEVSDKQNDRSPTSWIRVPVLAAIVSQMARIIEGFDLDGFELYVH